MLCLFLCICYLQWNTEVGTGVTSVSLEKWPPSNWCHAHLRILVTWFFSSLSTMFHLFHWCCCCKYAGSVMSNRTWAQIGLFKLSNCSLRYFKALKAYSGSLLSKPHTFGDHWFWQNFCHPTLFSSFPPDLR